MRTWLFCLLLMSAHGAAFPDGWLDLTETQRWLGVAFVLAVNVMYHLVRPALYRKLNEQ